MFYFGGDIMFHRKYIYIHFITEAKYERNPCFRVSCLLKENFCIGFLIRQSRERYEFEVLFRTILVTARFASFASFLSLTETNKANGEKHSFKR